MTSRRWLQQAPSLIWLAVAGLVLAAAFLIWVWLAVSGRTTTEAQVSNDSIQTETRQSMFDQALGALTDVVPVLSLKKDTPTEQHSPEFRAASFIETQASNWTLQIMNVSNETIVTDYLSKRADRSQFHYFRFVEGRTERFILTYGIFTTMQTTMGALQTNDFGLPNSVKAFPERFSSYKPYVSGSSGDEKVRDSTVHKARQIDLKPVPLPQDPVMDVTVPEAKRGAAGTSEPAYGALPNESAAPTGTVSDGFSDQPDAPPPEPSSPGTGDATMPAVQDPFNGQ